MRTRVCCACGEAKSVSGIWYLVNEDSGGFMCGACFSQTESPRHPQAPGRGAGDHLPR